MKNKTCTVVGIALYSCNERSTDAYHGIHECPPSTLSEEALYRSHRCCYRRVAGELYARWRLRVGVSAAHHTISKENLMPAASINFCAILGRISDQGMSLSYTPSGAAKASGTLIVTETRTDGRESQSYIDITIWGKKAEEASTIAAGALALMQGKLKSFKTDLGQWKTGVEGFELTPITAAVPDSAALAPF